MSTAMITPRNSRKYGPRPRTLKSQTDALVKLLNGPAPRDTLRLTVAQKDKMVEDGLIIRAREVVRTGKQGRPAMKYRLTDRGRSRAKRIKKQRNS